MANKMINVTCEFGDFTVSYRPSGALSCQESIVIRSAGEGTPMGDRLPIPIPTDVENRVLRLALYDLKRGYQKLEDL